MFSPLELLLQQIHLTLWQHHKGGKWGFKTRQEQQQTLLWGVERNHLHFALTQRSWQDRTQGPLGVSKRECTAKLAAGCSRACQAVGRTANMQPKALCNLLSQYIPSAEEDLV